MANPTQYYAYVPKGSSQESFKTTGTASFNSSLPGDLEYSLYPNTSSIDVKYFYETSEYDTSKKEIYALKNTLNRNTVYSPHFAYSSSHGSKEKQKLALISIPSIFYGSSIEKGTVEISFYVSGTLIGKLQDIKKNGEMIETTGSNVNLVAGVVLYNEGFIILTGAWNLSTLHDEVYVYSPSVQAAENPKWIHWGAGCGITGSNNLTTGSSFDLNFKGINYVPTITMLAHANKGDMNHSNNLTYIKYGELKTKGPITSSNSYLENEQIEIKNIVKYPYENYSGSLEKQTYISKIGIYDEKRNLIAVAKMAKPVKKTENRAFTFKLKLDI
jgi:hypothetical protein